METQTRGKGTIDYELQEFVGTLADANPTRLSKRSQTVPLQDDVNLQIKEIYCNYSVLIECLE